MARIYYDKKKLYGKPFKSATLNINSFKYIFENTIIEKNFPKKLSLLIQRKKFLKRYFYIQTILNMIQVNVKFIFQIQLYFMIMKIITSLQSFILLLELKTKLK